MKTLLIVLLPLSLFGQSKTLKVSLFFDNDQFTLRSDARRTIDKALDSLNKSEIFRITITGHTDSSADSLYNVNLSNDRAEKAKNYLVQKGIDINVIKTNFFGEEKPIATNNDDDGKQKNRRVDLVFSYKPRTITKEIVADTVRKKVAARPIQKEKPIVSKCKEDTLIILPNGTQVIFNQCEYLKVKDCLDFTEANNAEAALANGLTLADTNGLPIASCGMLRIGMRQGCTSKDCFDYPVKVRFRVPEDPNCDYCRRNARIWDLAVSGGWTQGQGKKNEVKIIKVQGDFFYQLEIFCPNSWKNCDCRMQKGKKLKVKIKRKYKILSLVVTSDCPTTTFVFRPNKIRKNIARKKVPCQISNAKVRATVMDKDGNILTLEPMPLNKLKKRTMCSRCKKDKKSIIGYRLGIFPIKERPFYRKHIIKPSQLKPKV